MKRRATFIVPLALFLLFLGISSGHAQQEERDLIQFSGVVVKSDSLSPVPFTNIIIRNEGRGTTADNSGYFSFVAKERDTILFSAVGFQKSSFIIPDSLKDHKYSLIHVMESDTVQLEEAVVYPWPSREEFRQAFLNADIPDDDLARARKNLNDEDMRERFRTMPMDASMNFNYEMQQYQNKLYYAGQTPPIQLLNPSAWAEFIRAWREGDFKQKD